MHCTFSETGLSFNHFAHGTTQNITLDDVIIKRFVRTLAFSGFGLIDVHGPKHTQQKARPFRSQNNDTMDAHSLHKQKFEVRTSFLTTLAPIFFFVNGHEDLLSIHGYKRVNTAGVFMSQQE